MTNTGTYGKRIDLGAALLLGDNTKQGVKYSAYRVFLLRHGAIGAAAVAEGSVQQYMVANASES